MPRLAGFAPTDLGFFIAFLAVLVGATALGGRPRFLGVITSSGGVGGATTLLTEAGLEAGFNEAGLDAGFTDAGFGTTIATLLESAAALRPRFAGGDATGKLLTEAATRFFGATGLAFCGDFLDGRPTGRRLDVVPVAVDRVDVGRLAATGEEGAELSTSASAAFCSLDQAEPMLLLLLSIR